MPNVRTGRPAASTTRRSSGELELELELELIEPHMTQKPMLRAEVDARALRV